MKYILPLYMCVESGKGWVRSQNRRIKKEIQEMVKEAVGKEEEERECRVV